MKQLKFIMLILCGLLFVVAAQATQRNLTVAASNTQAQKRVALIIGNAAYQGSPALRNPVNDARAMSEALNLLGFQVIEVTDATQKEMNRAITSFGSKLNGETAALFFYAGHGLQVKGKNYIIPVDAQIETESSVASESVSVDTILEQLNISPVSIVILDACRNNPFERSFRKMGGGLAQMDAPKGSFIAYATAPGKTAADGDGRNGLFTQELLKQINEPGLTLESVFKRVRSGVSAKSGDAQIPWDSSSMTGEFYFKPGNAAQAVIQGTTPARIKSREEIEQDAWESARESNNAGVILEYLKQYPKGRFIGQARVLIATLKAGAEKQPIPQIYPASALEDGEAVLWGEAQAGNGRDGYRAYLDQYPNGKYAALAKTRLNMLEASDQDNRKRYEQLLAEGDVSLKTLDKKTALAKYGAAQGLYPESPELVARLAQARTLVGVGDKFSDPLKDGSAGPEMVVLPSGKFQMGDVEGVGDAYSKNSVPVREVTIQRPFAIGEYEITFDEFDKFSRATGRTLLSDHGWGRGRRPAIKIGWDDVTAYLQWLGEQTGKNYRLPTEAEWEYAARAGTSTRYWWGNEPSHEYANYGDGQPGWFPSGVVSGRDQWMYTAPVGQFPPNPFGLFDMQGNVWEWVADCWHDSYVGAPSDGTAYGKIECENRIMRGGSWGYNPNFMRADARVKVFWGVLSFLYYGIRVVRDID